MSDKDFVYISKKQLGEYEFQIMALRAALSDQFEMHSLNPCPKCHIYGITSKETICDKCRIEELEDFLVTLKDTSGRDDIEMIEKVLKGGK